MTPDDFIKKWQDNSLSEKAGAQSFFLDLCDLLGVDKPADPENYCFERGAKKTGSGDGWADVWKRGYFAWENKGPHANLSKALKQLMTYALALDNPPLLVVCDRGIIEIHTHFTGTPSETYTIRLEEVGRPENLQRLRWLFTEPDQFKPKRTVRDITAEAAGQFAAIAQALAARGHEPHAIAHFLIQCLFCMFAEDVGLLPRRLFGRIVEKSAGNPEKLAVRLGELFTSMRTGGEFLLEDIQWFNGGLFENVAPLPLEAEDVKVLVDVSRMDWSHIEPSILGTLFERGLDPAMRAQLGANYTDPDTIGKIIEPVIVRPLSAEWEAAKSSIAVAMTKYAAGGKGSQVAFKQAQETFLGFINRVSTFRVLDPACGSGNFLYLALRALKDLEHRANLDAEALGLHRQITIEASPANLLGIEINPYAAELARVTVWIGEIQWMLGNGYDIQRKPILSPLDQVQCRDAVLNEDGSEAEWPAADAIIGNPPFLGNKKMIATLGEAYTSAIRRAFGGRLPGGVDLVVYWFEKGRAQIEAGLAQRAGLVATQSIRKGANRVVLDRIVASSRIIDAWRDEPWVNEGASVRVSLVTFGKGLEARLDGIVIDDEINPDLTPSCEGLDVTRAAPLASNSGVAFQGTIKFGAFDVPGSLARQWLLLPNPNGKPNSDVLRPWANGRDLVGRGTDTWIIDFGVGRAEGDASCYEEPFHYLEANVRNARSGLREVAAARWWLHTRPRPEMRKATANIQRYIATPRVARRRFFVWLPVTVLPDSRLYAICRDDDVTFGVLSSRVHLVWALANASHHGVGNDPTYNARDCFETFAFPEGLTPNLPPVAYANPHAGEISVAAKTLHELRERWLNPAEWVDRIPEVVAGYPDRIVAKPGHEADLKRRTLTNLYNTRPAWLDNAHKALDAAVAKAYGWDDYTPAMPDDAILRRLLALNQARAKISQPPLIAARAAIPGEVK